MSDARSPIKCPICETQMSSGYVSVGNGMVWHDSEPGFVAAHTLFGRGTKLFGGAASFPGVKTLASFKCSQCDAVVVTGK